jgi:hypothetical protein
VRNEFVIKEREKLNQVLLAVQFETIHTALRSLLKRAKRDAGPKRVGDGKFRHPHRTTGKIGHPHP